MHAPGSSRNARHTFCPRPDARPDLHFTRPTARMAANQSGPAGNLDRYVVIHVATTCDEHGVYVTKDSAEVIEIGWILLDAKTCEEVRRHARRPFQLLRLTSAR